MSYRYINFDLAFLPFFGWRVSQPGEQKFLRHAAALHKKDIAHLVVGAQVFHLAHNLIALHAGSSSPPGDAGSRAKACGFRAAPVRVISVFSG